MIADSEDVVSTTDCLVVGHYEVEFSMEVQSIASMGKDSGSYRDLRLAYVEVDGRPYRAMDLINYFRRDIDSDSSCLHNLDFLWPSVAQLVTYLSRQGLEVDYVNLPHLEREAFANKLRRAPQVVAITTTLHVAPGPILDLIPFIRKHAPDATIVVGGPFIYNQSRALNRPDLEDLFAYLGADIYVISRAGEGALAEITRAVRLGETCGDIANIVFRAAEPEHAGRKRTDDKTAISAARLRAWAEANRSSTEVLRQKLKSRAASTKGRHGFQFNQGPDEDHPLENNRVDFDLFPRGAVGPFASLSTSNSCPFACAFCGFPERAGAYRYLGVGDIAVELEKLKEFGVKYITFIDDTLNVPKGRFKEMLRLMIEREYEFRWNCFYRADHGDEETIELMRRAGCEAVFVGVESGSDRILATMNKTARRKHYIQSIPMLRDVGILTHANFIVGFPGETADSVAESIDLIEVTRPDTYRAQLWYCDPVTPIWRARHEHGVQGQAFNWRHATMDCREAAEWVDHMFLNVTESVWLPQHSFEQWSILYLAHHGMSREAIFAFMHQFNELIRNRLRHDANVPDRETLAILRELASFRRHDDLPAQPGKGTTSASSVRTTQQWDHDA